MRRVASGPPRAGALDVHPPAAAGHRREARDAGQRLDPRTGTLGEVQVVLHQGVLRALAAAGHARTALGAPGPRRACPAEVRVRYVDARLGASVPAEEHPDRGEHGRCARRPSVWRPAASPGPRRSWSGWSPRRASARRCRSAARARPASRPDPPTAGRRRTPPAGGTACWRTPATRRRHPRPRAPGRCAARASAGCRTSPAAAPTGTGAGPSSSAAARRRRTAGRPRAPARGSPSPPAAARRPTHRSRCRPRRRPSGVLDRDVGRTRPVRHAHRVGTRRSTRIAAVIQRA